MGTSRNATPLVVSHYSSFSDFALAGNFWGLVLLSRLPPVSFYRQDSISCFPLPAQCLFTGTVVSPTLLSLVFWAIGARPLTDPFDLRSGLSPRARFATSVIAEVLAIGRGAACAFGPVDTVSRDGPQENFANNIWLSIAWVYGESTHSDGGCRSPWTTNQTEKSDPGAQARHTGHGDRRQG